MRHQRHGECAPRSRAAGPPSLVAMLVLRARSTLPRAARGRQRLLRLRVRGASGSIRYLYTSFSSESRNVTVTVVLPLYVLLLPLTHYAQCTGRRATSGAQRAISAHLVRVPRGTASKMYCHDALQIIYATHKIMVGTAPQHASKAEPTGQGSCSLTYSSIGVLGILNLVRLPQGVLSQRSQAPVIRG